MQCSLEYTTLRRVTEATEIYYDPIPDVRLYDVAHIEIGRAGCHNAGFLHAGLATLNVLKPTLYVVPRRCTQRQRHSAPACINCTNFLELLVLISIDFNMIGVSRTRT